MSTTNKNTGNPSSLRRVSRYLVVATIASTSACDSNTDFDLPDEPPSSLRSSATVAAMNSSDGTTCMVTQAGDVKCWGRNDSGQLGRGDDMQVGDDETLDTVGFVELGGVALHIVTNGEQTYALLDSGVVRAWGQNGQFELSLGHAESIGDDETPASAGIAVDLRIGGPVAQLAAGADFACARLDDGAVRCWGANNFGQLGYGHTEAVGDDEAPEDAGDLALGGTAMSIAAGAHHACALLDDGAVRCWGLGQLGQLGYGNTDNIGDNELPASVGAVMIGDPVAEIVAGGHHTCARLESGTVRCWGAGIDGQLGYGNTDTVGDDELPRTAGDVPVGGPAVGLAAGLRHTCAVLSGGGLRCWGHGSLGRLGYGDTNTIGDDEIPAAIGDVNLGSRQVSAVFIGATASSTCVQLDDGTVRCWGRNDAGQLGYGHTDPLGGEAATEPDHLPDIIVVDDSDN